MWKSMASINLMLPKEDRKAMLLRVYNDDSPLIDHSQQTRKNVLGQNGAKEEPQTTVDLDDEGGVKLADDAVDTEAALDALEEEEAAELVADEVEAERVAEEVGEEVA